MNVKQIKADLISKNKKYAIVASRFNELITTKLLEGSIDALTRHGVKENEIEVYWVPGAFEIAYLADRLAKSKKYNAIICVGAVIKGSTSHFDLVAESVARNVAQVSIATGVPVIFGVITTENVEQAIERAGTKAGNKGWDAALSAIEMANLYE